MNWRGKWLRRIATPLADAYRGAVQARRSAYESGRKSPMRLTRPVISIGNLTMGGTGKTPSVSYLAQKLSEDFKVSILTRGYGRKNRQYLTLNVDNLDAGAVRLFGDEAVMLAHQLPQTVSIHVGTSRYKLGLHALENGSVDVFLLDDGFQHIELHRDLDIVMIDGQVDLAEEDVIPAGTLREKPDALKKADILWIHRCKPDGSHLMDDAWLSSVAPDASIIKSCYEPQPLVHCRSKTIVPREEIGDKKIFTFCGIGQPQSFHDTLDAMGINRVGFKHFRDHHVFKPKELEELRSLVAESGADTIITTEKDAVRLNASVDFDCDLLVLPVRMKLIEGEDGLWERIYRTIENSD